MTSAGAGAGAESGAPTTSFFVAPPAATPVAPPATTSLAPSPSPLSSWMRFGGSGLGRGRVAILAAIVACASFLALLAVAYTFENRFDHKEQPLDDDHDVAELHEVWVRPGCITSMKVSG
eukprot:TRINITY_DN4647_c0_g1_i1.p1 TRINITY_DN4647_c0_g1~~TRINITY_DN4647_c0_g1_i1.p1  ORF type:complete len:120 (+),score=30.74 TRINITY_DN4647_c0_g1_i1:424-783(+)